MNRQRILAIVIGSLVLVAAVVVYLELQLLGFPDGFLTDLDRARKTLIPVWIGISVAVGVWLIGLGATSPPGMTAKLRITLAVYGLVVLLTAGIDFYLRHSLNSGGGG
jgi:hypothetical protein